MTAFERLHPALQHHIVNSLGWRELREVQSLSIAAFLDGANLVILAPTAGGKTEAAFFPVLSQMLAEPWKGLRLAGAETCGFATGTSLIVTSPTLYHTATCRSQRWTR